MLETLTGLGLASAAGLNAYIPLLALGLLDRFTELVTLPAGWAWLGNEWVLVIVGVLTLVEIVADKIPVVDSNNDVLQTVVRPTSGGIVFGAGTAAQTEAVTDPAAFFTSNAWIPIAIGIVVALVTHLVKASTRAAATTVSAGTASPVLSVGEDAVSIGPSAAAILAPIVVILMLIGVGAIAWAASRYFRARRRHRRERDAAGQAGAADAAPTDAGPRVGRRR